MKQHVVIFILFSLIIIPAVFLSYFAFEGIDQREADMRNSFSNTLLLELTQTNTRIAYLLDEMREDLHESLPRGLGEDTGKKLAAWNMQEPLIGMPYLVSPDRRILYPDLAAPGGDEGFADAVNLFYWRHLNFFNSSEPIPVYKSIALAYEEEILLSQNAREESLDEYASADSGSVAMSKKEAAPSPSLSRSKAASGIFETNEAVQEEVYRRAEEEGRMPLTRNVLPRLAEDKPADDTNNAGIRSVFIESTQYFNDLIRDQDYGLIPRVFDSAFMLLFWEKQGDLIAGCELDMDAVKDLLLSALPAPADQTRYINILDNSGRPLVPFATLDETQWQRPFVAKEINELLPYWETASILTDPDAFEEQVRSSRLFMLTLIILLSAAILTGMTAVYRFSAAQLKTVQQKAGFITRVSHELKTPLTSIRMYSEMLAEGRQSDPSRQKKYLRYIASESVRLSGLISNVLDYAKLEKGTKQLSLKTLDLSALVRDYVACVQDEFQERGFRLYLEENDAPVFADIDREAFTQVLVNLVNNAEKYSSPPGEILIQTAAAGGKVSVSVTDSGTGIAPRYRRKIFKDFYRIDNRLSSETQGTGLGLAIARRIIKAHGGTLTLEPKLVSDYTKGSVFTITLVRKEQP